jgi:hypothetical protein
MTNISEPTFERNTSLQELLQLFPLSQREPLWLRFVTIAQHGCSDPAVIVKLALRPLYRAYKNKSITADEYIVLLVSFSHQSMVKALAAAAIRQAKKAVAHD